eukprot:s173_g30.t1
MSTSHRSLEKLTNHKAPQGYNIRYVGWSTQHTWSTRMSSHRGPVPSPSQTFCSSRETICPKAKLRSGQSESVMFCGI